MMNIRLFQAMRLPENKELKIETFRCIFAIFFVTLQKEQVLHR